MKAALLLGLFACAHAHAEVIPASAPQLVTAVIDDWSATHATLTLWKRDGARWVRDGESWPAVIGKSGAAWGMGLHGTGAPDGEKGPVKREGDGASPAGVFAVRGAYGYADTAKTKLPYLAMTPTLRCVDDPRSTHYATIVDDKDTTVDWASSEPMRRSDALYTWVVDLAHNGAHTPGGGSCIFLHVWGGADSPTVGCTAMAEPQLAALLAKLDPRAVFVLLPKSEYAALAPRWHLPGVSPHFHN